MGIKEQIIFPEINFDDVKRIRGFDITIVTNKILNKILPVKVVDCLTKGNIGYLFNSKRESTLPCTPNAVVERLKRSNIEMQTKNIVIVGRSDIVGKPLGLLPCRSVSQGVVWWNCLPKTAWPPT